MLIQANRGPTDGPDNTNDQGNPAGQGQANGQGSTNAQGSTNGPCPSVDLLLSPVSIKKIPLLVSVHVHKCLRIKEKQEIVI